MNHIKYLILAFLLSAVIAGCEKGQEAATDDNFHPRIIDGNGVFISPKRIIFQGTSAVYNGLTFSPKPIEKAKISWKVNGVEVSTDTTYTFTPTAGGEYQVKVEATYNGQTSTRISNVLVSPTTYTPKTYTNIAMAYLTEDATVADVDFANVTHVTYKGFRVAASGAVDFSKATLNQTGDELVARAHIAHVPVLLGISGTLSGIDGWSLYNSNEFGAVISDATKRAALVTTVAEYVINHRLDGVDVMMTDLSNDFYNISAANAQSVGPFITALKAALPAGSLVTATVTTNYMHWEYANLAVADWVNVHAFEEGTFVGPGAPRGQASSLAYMQSCAAIWANKIDKSKIVIGIPAFGLRYTAIDGAGNNLSWGSYGYIKYKDILAIDPLAYNKEMINTDFGIYFNGIPLVDQKTAYIKANGYKGAYLYAGDYDVKGTNSLMAAIYKTLK
ncbi:hypothetical protein LPB86_08000 [Pedobacter sp. MC2016-14]|uniref:glycosyl hydrolase family 18 protein n=1 Tax=Pedobacter sp. MC2016-14 TaxID=2897327 RepID=UPI001E658F74|nr:glycosyl hydrolase family 18 protein [Pedobacter sp. MC2016-14]MCD0488168.1 hypothetical protein [Pedobacter sp. MC2016-14]